MIKRGRGPSQASSLRLALGAGVVAACALFAAAPALAQQPALLPQGFFDSVDYDPAAQAAIEADNLTYSAADDVITAGGGVIMVYKGYTLRTDRLVYHRNTGEAKAEGDVELVDPQGTVMRGRDLEITGGFKTAFINSLTLRTTDGSLITADSADYSSEAIIVLRNGTYAPCGECIDAKGRRIGWKVRAPRMVYNRDDASMTLEQPMLELLGIPMAWLPWLRLPDPTQPRANGFRVPRVDFDRRLGASLTYPYFIAIGNDTDLVLSPTLMSRQGGLFAADITHRFGTFGTVTARVAGVYQIDRSAFAGTVGDRDWRGAFQTAGEFTPAAHWTVGWSYTTFTDAAFLPDYKLVEGKNSVNQAYATYLARDLYGDFRLQRFNLLGNVTAADQLKQGAALPNIETATVTDLGGNLGQIRTAIRILGVERTSDHVVTTNGVKHVFGFAENKVHASAEASWQSQFIVPGGVAVTPFLGLRADAAFYDGSSADPSAPPGAVSLLSATPIAAIDVRWPLVMDDGLSSYLFEPIAQVVYRGSATTTPGITNDDSLSFGFDDTNLFSYNRFTGIDRQETGLRANVGGHFLANFADGSWLDLVGGQSYFLGGVNSLGLADPSMVGASTGLGAGASYFVLGAQAGFNSEFTVGGKLQVDPAAPRVTLGTLRASYANAARFSAGLDYTYIAADPVVGRLLDQHEIGASVGVPIGDYWSARAGAAWDVAGGTWLESSFGVFYDDGYLDFGAGATFTGPTHSTPNDIKATASFHLKGPRGASYGLSAQ